MSITAKQTSFFRKSKKSVGKHPVECPPPAISVGCPPVIRRKKKEISYDIRSNV